MSFDTRETSCDQHAFWPCPLYQADSRPVAPSKQPFVVRFDPADSTGKARFANVGYVNKPIGEPNWFLFDNPHRLITAGTHHDGSLCFRSEHGPVPHQTIAMLKCGCSVAADTYQQAPRFRPVCPARRTLQSPRVR